MSSPNRKMCPILNPLLLGSSSELMTNGAVDYEVLQNVILIIGANFIGDRLVVSFKERRAFAQLNFVSFLQSNT